MVKAPYDFTTTVVIHLEVLLDILVKPLPSKASPRRSRTRESSEGSPETG